MDAMKSNPRMMWLCVVIAVLAIALVVAGVFGAWFLLFALPCAAMMGAMVWMMLSVGGGGHKDA